MLSQEEEEITREDAIMLQPHSCREGLIQTSFSSAVSRNILILMLC